MKDGVELLVSAAFEYSIGEPINLHRHDFFQMFYCLDGQGAFVYDKTEYSLKKGGILFFKPNVEHGMKPVKNSPIRILDMKFLIRDKVMYTKAANLPLDYTDEIENVKELLNMIYNEAKSKKLFYSNMISDYINLLLMIFMRRENGKAEYCKQAINEDQYRMLGTCAKRTLRFIEGNVIKYSTLTLENVANILGYNKQYMCRCFLQEVGIGINQYLALLRIDKAKELLVTTENNVTEISNYLGYNDLSYFVKQFIKDVGCSPTDYRKKFNHNDQFYRYTFRFDTDKK